MRCKYAWLLFIPLLFASSILAAQEKPSESELDLNRRYVVLSTGRYSTLNQELNRAVAAGYAVVMGNTASKILILEKQPEGAPRREFKVVENLSNDLKKAAKEGFRLIPATVGAKNSMFSIQSAGVVERTPDSQERFEYRVLKTARTSSLEKDINKAAAQGYRAIALPTNTSRNTSLSGKNHIAIMERPVGVTAQLPAGSATGATAYLLLATNESSTLQKELDDAAKNGYCALLGAGGNENMLLLQKCPADAATPEYLLLATTKSGTLEKEMNEAASRGYRPLPLTMAPVRKRVFPFPGRGADWSETTIVMEKTNAPTAVPTHLVIGTRRVGTFIKELANAEQNDFEMMGMMLSYTEKMALLAKTPSAPVRRQAGAPAHHLIQGVPFVSWGEGAALNYRWRDILEPSAAAVDAMDLEYWGYSPKLLEDPKPAFDKWPNVFKKDASLEDIKQFVDRDIPVRVFPTLTPFAHRLYISHVVFAIGQGLDLQMEGSSTGILGEMVSLEKLRKLRAENPKVVNNESTDLAARLVIGYDDERQVVIMHDPSFGPAWEVSYADFDKMWSFYGRSLYALIPPDSAKILANRAAPGPYPPRTPDNEAAVRYVYGYAEEYIGRAGDAERDFRQALAIPGISVAYQHLLHFDLATTVAQQGRANDSIAEAQKAIDLYPDDPAPWRFMAAALEHFRVGSDWKKRANEAAKRAVALCTEQNERKVAQMLAKDFRIVGCKGKYLGWGLR